MYEQMEQTREEESQGERGLDRERQEQTGILGEAGR